MYKLTGLVLLLNCCKRTRPVSFFWRGLGFPGWKIGVLFEAGFGFFFFFWGLEEGVEVAFHADKGT